MELSGCINSLSTVFLTVTVGSVILGLLFCSSRKMDVVGVCGLHWFCKHTYQNVLITKIDLMVIVRLSFWCC